MCVSKILQCTSHIRVSIAFAPPTNGKRGGTRAPCMSISAPLQPFTMNLTSQYIVYTSITFSPVQSSPAQSVTLPPLQALVEILNFHFPPLPSKCLMTCIATHPFFEASSLPPAYMPTIKHIRLGVCTSPPCHKKNLHMCNPYAHLPISILLPRHK